MSGLVLFGGVFAAAYLFVAFLAVRRPLLTRLAFREAVRRRGQSLLVIGGLMIGSAAITAALIGADSADRSATLNAYRTWGLVDVVVTKGGAVFPEDTIARLRSDPRLDGLVDGLQGGLELVGSAADLDQRQGESGIRLIGFDPSSQAAFGAYVLADGHRTTGADLGPGDVLLSRQLAAALHARVGDRLRVTVDRAEGAGEPPTLRVAGVARSLGPGAYGLRPAVFAPLATAQAIAGLDGIDVIRVSAAGGLQGGVAGANRALPVLREVVGRRLGIGVFDVKPVKRTEVDQARQGTEFLRSMLIGMSALIVAAGVALVVNLITMLAEERRPRLAVLRALGLTRRGLVTLSVLEGAIYSLVAAAVGTGLGVLAGRVVAARFARAFAQFFGGTADFRFVFALRLETLAVGFAGGALITLGTVFIGARRTSRMTIAAAIRDLPEPAQPRRRAWPRRVLLGVGAVAGVAGVAGPDKVGRLTGGIALILVASALVRSRLSPRTHATLTGLLLAVWSIGIVNTVTSESDPNVFFAVFTVAVLASVFGLSILAAANLRLVERAAGALGRLSRSLLTTLRPPLAYLARRPLRTGLATGVFAVIIAIVTVLAVFLSIFRPRYERDSAGYEVRVLSTGSASVAIPASVRPDVAREADIDTRGYVGRLTSSFGTTESAFIPLFGFSDTELRDPPARISARDDRYDTDAEVWAAVGRDPSLVVAEFGNPGDKLVLEGPSGPVRFTIAANQQFGILDGIIGGPAALARFPSAQRGVTILLDTKPGANPAAVARRIEATLFDQGVDAATTRSLLDKGYQANRTFFSVIDVLMRLGLIVGILSLGILGLRAVVERRRVIGVLRAIGYKRRAVMGGLMAEAGVTATIGVLVGASAGTALGYIFFRQTTTDATFGIDGASFWSALGLVYVAVLLVTLGPAWRASRLPPAEAVRHSE